MARLFNVQCALHDPNCHAHARYLFESVEESTTSNSVPIKGMQIFNSPQSGTKRLCFGEFFRKLPGTFKEAVSDKETFGTNFM
ncbi:hypothetical protein T12_8863 [Trichinella patagoniensis]|uniref:Uncharacterized protein n=1 Tax=Trichinella patagoniensis TaxID=990121 RepID=A0A0V0Z4N2_9BILA|nr:hypothetical protein T12_8863 [Trichinella patagoniensis]